MSRWFRSAPFRTDHLRQWVERWEYRPVAGAPQTFELDVQTGKPLDVLSLKGVDLSEARSYAEFLVDTAKRLYRDKAALQRLASCPICRAAADGAKVELEVFQVPYVRCTDCGHVYVATRPPSQVLDAIFCESDGHSTAYLDKDALKTRMSQIIAPKLDWCLATYRRVTGGQPRTVLDVGAGGGHFLAGAARRGLKVEGFEKSRSSRAFSREAFGLDLCDDDFLNGQARQADLVTFWGLLEYVAEPRAFIAAARRALEPGGMLVVEVPRVDALGTLVQTMKGAVIARHMDPTSHVNAFSDASLCTALVEEGFAPTAVWYFGMDAYEMCVQIALQSGNAEMFVALAPFIPVLQEALDRGRQCDDIVIAAVPQR